MNEDTVADKQTLIDYFDQFIQHAILKELKEQQLEKIQNEWSYFKQLLEKLQQDPQRIPIYLDILKKSKETQGGIQLVPNNSSNNQQPQMQSSKQPNDKITQQFAQSSNNMTNQQSTSPVQVQSPLLNNNSSNLIGKSMSDQQTQSKDQIQGKYQNQYSAQQVNYNNKLGQQQPIFQSLNAQQSNQISEQINSASNPLGSFQQTNQASSNQIKQENQQVKRKESTDIQSNNLFQNLPSTPQLNTASSTSKHFTDQNTQALQQALFLSKDRSSNSNLSSFNSGDQQNSFQSFSQEQQLAQQNYQKSINTTPVKIEPKSIFEEQKNKFRFQRDKIKSKVKSILNLFKENNIYLNKEDVNENTENVDVNAVLNQSKQNGASNIYLKKQQSDGGPSISKTNNTTNLLNIQTPDINLNKTNLKIDQIQQPIIPSQNQNLVRNNSSNNVSNQQQISNPNNPNLTYSNSSNNLINQDSFQTQQNTSLPISSNFAQQNTNLKGANLSHFSNQNTTNSNSNNNLYQNNNFNTNQQQQQMSNSKRNVFTQQISINSQNQQISNQVFQNN